MLPGDQQRELASEPLQVDVVHARTQCPAEGPTPLSGIEACDGRTQPSATAGG